VFWFIGITARLLLGSGKASKFAELLLSKQIKPIYLLFMFNDSFFNSVSLLYFDLIFLSISGYDT
jgi:hypothetical protein